MDGLRLVKAPGLPATAGPRGGAGSRRASQIIRRSPHSHREIASAVRIGSRCESSGGRAGEREVAHVGGGRDGGADEAQVASARTPGRPRSRRAKGSRTPPRPTAAVLGRSASPREAAPAAARRSPPFLQRSGTVAICGPPLGRARGGLALATKYSGGWSRGVRDPLRATRLGRPGVRALAPAPHRAAVAAPAYVRNLSLTGSPLR